MQEYRHNAISPYHISCGGVVFSQSGDRTDVLLLARYQDDKATTYHLPKGTLHHDETLEDCARREIREESGYAGAIVGYIGAFTYSFDKNDLEVDKTVHYFAVQSQKKVGTHDAEHDEVYWKEIATARRLLEKQNHTKKNT